MSPSSSSRPTGITCERFDQHDVGGTDRGTGSTRVDRFDTDVVAVELAEERCGGMSGIQREDANITPSDQPLPDDGR